MSAALIHDGGPAFPVAGEEYSQNEHRWKPVIEYSGMSLRDYFAAQAMQAYFSDGAGYNKSEDAARWAYQIADAMIKARSA